MLTPATLQAIDDFWAGMLGAPTRLLHEPGVHVAALGGAMSDYRGAYLLRHEASLVFCAPAHEVERTRHAALAYPADSVFTPTFPAALFGSAVDRIVGPAYQGFADAATFTPVERRGTRPLGDGEAPALERLRAACDATEWEHSGISSTRPSSVFACFVGRDIAAAGVLGRGRDPVSSVGILTHPAYRGRGYGRAVVSTMTAHALENGRRPRYQTLLANAPSVAIARSLGYVEYGRTLAVRLREMGATA